MPEHLDPQGASTHDGGYLPLKGALGLLKLCDPTPRLPPMRASHDTLRRLAEILSHVAAEDERQAAG